MTYLPRRLGLDIGTHTGWAIAEGSKLISSGVRDFTLKAHERKGHRGIRFYNFLLSLGQIDEIFYEKVQFSMNTKSADHGELYKGFLMLVHMYAAGMDLSAEGTHPSTLKKAFTGRGDAKKFMMCDKAREYGWKGGMPGTEIDNDEADAIALLVTQLREKYGLNVSF